MKEYSILVVGGAGYIGTHMVKELLEAGHNVVILDNLSTGNRELVAGGTFIEGNLGDAGLLDQLFSNYRIDVVMYFAAYSLVGESVVNPLKYYRNNLAETIELLDAMKRHNVDHFIFSSSAAVYGEPVEAPVTEAHPCNPTNPYGETKLAIERMLEACDLAHGLKYVSLRYFNAAGADESGAIGEKHKHETHLIPLILKVAAGELENIEIFGTDYPTADGTCIRDYIHVTDLASAHLLAMEYLMNKGRSAVYNLGNSTGYSVLEVIKTAEKVTGRSIQAVPAGRRRGDPAVLIAGSDKIRQQLGWRPRYEDLEIIIKTAWGWHGKDLKDSV
jgi:UDP-glucose 4-epimerase